MLLIAESNSLEEYLLETDDVDFGHLSLKEKATELSSASSDEEDFVKNAYEFVRDEISHSWRLIILLGIEGLL